MDLFLIRHPRPLVADGVCYGRTDLALAEAVAVPAGRLRPLLPAGAPLYSSPLRRCLELARAIGPEPRQDARLQELDFGRWEGRAWDDIHREEPHALDLWARDTAHAAPHGGETAMQLQARALAWVAERTAEEGEAVVVVTHGGVLKALCGHWLGLAPADWSRLHFDFAAVSRVELGPAGPRILSLNR
ncbi:MAG TPA: alpha-ribazole phosphatase family protein [Azospira sp.]|nr:alpha-ribazole phosphatase family protein [Azospira sp.]